MTMNLQPALQTFIAESKDLLAEMESALLELEKDPYDEDQITSVFRSIHTIKGSSGVFGFNNIVEFTHVMESMLEEVRAGDLIIDSDIIALLLLCGDHVSVLLGEITDEEHVTSAETQLANTALLERLKLYVNEEELNSSVDSSIEESTPEEDVPGSNVISDAWHISIRFGDDVLRNGMDPLSFIRYMESTGEIVNIQTLCDSIPDADHMDPESCYLGVEIDYMTAAQKREIEEIFDFVRDDCEIHILPPHSKILDYISLIEELPEDNTKLGELLVKCKSLTEIELEEGLKLQREIDEKGGVTDSSGHKQKLGDILVSQGVVHTELVDAALKKQSLIKKNLAVESTLMRVRADKLDELITQVGELVIAASGARLLAHQSGDTELTEASINIEELVEQVRESAFRLRMVPIGETFNRFNRVVRDLSRELGKDVDLVIRGSDTEIDKSMVEKISDPLMHLIRNSLDHGIETVGMREAARKTRAGRINLNAYHDAGTVVIEVGDDGAGLDRDRILAKAIDNGLITPEAELSDAEIFQLIMEPGFSTADEVTDVSGRGVGMDVVKDNVERLRGSITIESVRGKGASFMIRLPLTLAIIEGFLVKVGDSSYVVPLDMVVECFELSESNREEIKHHDYVNLRDEVLPLLRLRDVFDIRAVGSRRENIVVIRYAGQQIGLVVDGLLGEFQTVIKPLGKIFEKLSGISGSSILGNGDVALILDVPTLVSQVEQGKQNMSVRRKGNHPKVDI